MSAPHDLARVPALLRERGVQIGRAIHFAEETGSTNDDAKRAARAGAAHGELFVAESQTAGRGRQGRAWISARGEDLLFSVILRLSGPKANMPLVALAAGLAVRDAVARVVPAFVFVKWPNDVLVREKKIAGVLVEGAGDALVVGVGLNVHARAFAPGIVATSVALESEEPPDRAELLRDVLEAIDRDAPLVAARGLGLVHARLEAADALRDRRVAWDGGEGIARGVDPEGRLVVRSGATEHRLAHGEVHLVSAPASRSPR